MKSKAVVLLSGGLDSATAAAIAKDEGYSLHALTFKYGQRHAIEIECALRVGKALGVVEHQVMELPIGHLACSALTGHGPVPKGIEAQTLSGEIPPTYVPGRNIVFLAIATTYAEAIGARDIFIGANAVDYSGYPDCRRGFLVAFENAILEGTKAGDMDLPICLRYPLIDMSKADIIRTGISLGLDLGMTHSCYDPEPDGKPCEQCDSCHIRRRGFEEVARSTITSQSELGE